MQLADTFARALRFRKRDAPRLPASSPALAGDPQTNDPAEQSRWTPRPPMLFPLTFPVQDARIGLEVKQAGAGRVILQPSLTFDVQSMTPEPDRRIIARPMPSSAVDERQVIRP